MLQLTIDTQKEYTVVDNYNVSSQEHDIRFIRNGNSFDIFSFTCFEDRSKWVSGKYKEIIIENRTEWRQIACDMANEISGVSPVSTPTATVNPVATVNPIVSNLEEVMLKAMATVLADNENIKAQVTENAVDYLKRFVEENYGPIKRTVTLINKDNTVKTLDVLTHKSFQDVLTLVNADIPVFLTGPAGSGKNHLCQQVAEALDLDFYFSNAVTQEFKITGFIDAHGTYHETEFYKAFKNGGLFMLDEIDASTPEVLVILNAAIANRYFDFPNGRINAHDDFRIISAGNTFGTGADMEYVGRFQLDGASLDRFALIEIGYDEDIQLLMAGQNETLSTFMTDLRSAIEEAGIKHIISYRAVHRVYKMEQALGEDELVKIFKTCVTKSLRDEDISYIMNAYSGNRNNKYYQALKTISIG